MRPKRKTIAEGRLPSGERWVLSAGGTKADYYTFLETIHPDGHRDSGGMGGPPLVDRTVSAPQNEHINVYTGMHDQGLQRVIVRTDTQVRKILAELNTGEQIEIPNVGSDPAMGLLFYTALLPRSQFPTSITALDSEGNTIDESPVRRIVRRPGDGSGWFPEATSD